MRSASRARSRAPQSFPGVGGSIVSATSHEPLDQTAGPGAEGQLRPSRGAEQVGDERDLGSPHVREEQRRPAGGDDPTVDLRRLEARVDLGLDHDQVAVAPQLLDEGPQVGEDGVAQAVLLPNRG